VLNFPETHNITPNPDERPSAKNELSVYAVNITVAYENGEKNAIIIQLLSFVFVNQH